MIQMFFVFLWLLSASVYMIMYAYTFLVISYTFASRNSEHICNNEDINVPYYSRPRFFNETSYVGSI